MRAYSRIFALSLLFLSFLGCKKEKDEKAGPPPPQMLQADGYIVKEEPFNSELIATANLLANEQIEIKAPISGQVLAIQFKEGQFINKNSPIIRIDDRIWKAQLVGLNAELLAATSDLTRKKSLLQIEGSTQAEIEMAQSTVDKLKSNIQQLEINIDLANISAPFSGVLGMRDFSTGAFLNTGDVITTLTETNQLKVDFMVAQEYLSSVAIGKSIDVVIGKDTLSAKIYAINPQISTSSRTINVRALLPASSKKSIMPGTYAEVLIATNKIEDALLIPTQAIVPQINKQTVFKVKNGKAERVDVIMGNRTDEKVHILEGIASGDTIITSGLLMVKTGHGHSV
jgi:membrane fusion protein (multidrug efflux system)